MPEQLAQYEAVSTSLNESIGTIRSQMADLALYVQSIEEHQVRIGHLSESLALLQSKVDALDAANRDHNVVIEELRAGLTSTSQTLADEFLRTREYLARLTEEVEGMTATIGGLAIADRMSEERLNDQKSTLANLHTELARIKDRLETVEQWKPGIELELQKVNNTILMLTEQLNEQILRLEEQTQTMFDHGIVSAMDPLRKAIGTLEHLYDELIVVYREVQELAAYAVEVNVRQDDLLAEQGRTLVVMQQDIAENQMMLLTELDRRFLGPEQHLAEMEQRFKENEQRLGDAERRFQATEQWFQETEKRFRQAETLFDTTEQRFKAANQRLGELEERFAEIERRLSDLRDLTNQVQTNLESQLDSRTTAVEHDAKERARQIEQKLMELQHTIKEMLSAEITAAMEMRNDQLAAIPYVQEQLLAVVRDMQDQLTHLQEENLLLAAAVEDLNRSNQLLQQEIARLRLGE